jgi:hypothetical protein
LEGNTLFFKFTDPETGFGWQLWRKMRPAGCFARGRAKLHAGARVLPVFRRAMLCAPFIFAGLLLFALAAWVAPSACQAASEIWVVTDETGMLLTYKQVTLYPNAVYTNAYQGYSALDGRMFFTDATGTVTFTNLQPGGYAACVLSRTNTCVGFTITNFASTNYIVNNSSVPVVPPNAQNAWSMLAGDLRYPSIPGAGILFVTNAGMVTVQTNGGSSGGGGTPIGSFSPITITPLGGTNYIGFTNSAAVNFTNTSNTFAGGYSGNGGGLTNLFYTNVNNRVNVVNVKDYGAVGAGFVDDTAAIQRALNYMATNGGRLYFPQGYYTISSQLVVSNGFYNSIQPVGEFTEGPGSAEIFGDGQGLSIIYQSTSGAHALVITNAWMLYLHDLSFATSGTLGTNSAATNSCGLLTYASGAGAFLNNNLIQNVAFYRWGNGYRGCMEDTKFDTCQFEDNWVSLWEDPTTGVNGANGEINNIQIINCAVTQGNQSSVMIGATNIVQVGFKLQGIGSTVVISASINCPAANAIGIMLSGGSAVVEDGHFEMTGGGVAFDTSYNTPSGNPNNAVLMLNDGQNPGGGTTNTYPFVCGTNTSMCLIQNGVWQNWPIQATTSAIIKKYTNSTSIANVFGVSLNNFNNDIYADVFNSVGAYVNTIELPTMAQSLLVNSNLTVGGLMTANGGLVAKNTSTFSNIVTTNIQMTLTPSNGSVIAEDASGKFYPTNLPAAPMWVTYDSSFGSDAGMVQESAYLAGLLQQGAAKLVLLTSSTPNNQTYGINDIDRTFGWYGVYAPLACSTNTANYLDPYGALAGLGSLQSVLNSPANAENSTPAYRRTLINAVNNHAQLLMFFQAELYNLYDLLNSPGDVYSSLNGSNLLALANPKLMVTGGVFPNGAEFNWTNGMVGRPSTGCLTNLPPNIVTWIVDYNLGTNCTVMASAWYNLVATISPVGLTSSPRPCWGEALEMAGIYGTNYSGTNMFTLNPVNLTIYSSGSNSTVANPASMISFLTFNTNSITTFSNAVNRTIAFAGSPQQNYGYGTLNITQTQSAASTQVGVITAGNYFPGFFTKVLGSGTTSVGMILDTVHANEPALIFAGVFYYPHASGGVLTLNTTP